MLASLFFCIYVFKNDNYKMEEVTLNGQTFQLQKSEGDGNCLLHTLLNYMEKRDIDPFRGVPVKDKSVFGYRNYLLTTNFKDSILQKLQQQAQSRQRGDYTKDCQWLTTDILPLVVALYPQIEKIYVLDRRYKSWSSYSFDGKRVKQQPVRTSFNFTDGMMMMQYTGNHFDLLKPINNRVVIKRKRSAEEELLYDADDALKELDDVNNQILTYKTLANDKSVPEADRILYEDLLAKEQQRLPELQKEVVLKKARYNNKIDKMIKKQEEKEKLSLELKYIESQLETYKYLEKVASVDKTSKKKELYEEIDSIKNALEKLKDGSSSDDAISVEEDSGSEKNSQTNSQPTDVSDDETKGEYLIQNRSLMSLSRMRL